MSFNSFDLKIETNELHFQSSSNVYRIFNVVARIVLCYKLLETSCYENDVEV